MKKRILSLLTTLVMVIGLTVCLPTITASAYYYFAGDYTLRISDGTVVIEQYDGNPTSLNVPSSLGGYTITGIGDYAFHELYNLTSVTIPDTITIIESGAFNHCESLTSITIPNSVTYIGDFAFSDCYDLKTAKIGNSVKSMGQSVFSYCNSLTSVTIPDSLTLINSGTFNECTSLTSIVLGNSVKSIGLNAFGYCSRLKKVVIPKSVTTIKSTAFFGCDNVVIYCYKNSTALTYAKDNDISYYILDMTVPTVSAKSTYTSTSSAVRINWNKVSGATGYRIYRYNSTTKKWVKVTTIKNGSTTTYKQTGLKSGTTYKYKVKAYIKDGGVNYWGNASSTITTSTKPATASFTTASKTKTAIRLNWKKVTGASGYQIQQYNSSTKKWSTVKTITSGSTLTYRISGLKKGTVYKYRIRAYRTVNSNKLYGAWSATKKVTTKS